MSSRGHVPVLYHETLGMLNLKTGKTIVDGTLGGGGHANGILEKITPGGKLVGIDRDAAAIERCAKRFSTYKEQVTLVHDNFKRIKPILYDMGIEKIDGAVLDLGVSSFQLDEGERGFSYNTDAPLDMRMDQGDSLSAYDVVNGYSESALEETIREYGEERWAARIARFIVKEREGKQIKTTKELTEAIKKAIPAAARRDGPHPAKRTFQAIRIEVNGELTGLREALEDYVSVLRSGGRFAVITFHSLEDRIVKQTFKRLFNPCECPKDLPVCVCGKVSQIKIITRKPILPGIEELEENPRARSAKLRVAEKR
ncbi:16S rRNA (cytosine(1402)-N(4))-methyltransferase RsmH [Christensenella tenuis]|uniref:Ribosomal RNA small subunit methyltransferase H n=1 Tax=Christensenella tenuis TaxID=2763033 RepID=A0ABR7EE14_9FIRM|nr:16S rRNA (cytosine(1402)-N(4))-methyltransferase RsmH [Christensenella tenuis]MBC5647329.1 16S rRNA (cytosine(1402)-N(4))-methyltransferase RsmH [Christensenella tenuis]